MNNSHLNPEADVTRLYLIKLWKDDFFIEMLKNRDKFN